MNILVITAQKPDSTGSGVYVAETVRAFSSAGHDVTLVAGIDAADEVTLPEGVSFHPVRFRTPELPYPVCGMSDQMPYEATRYRDMTPEMCNQFKHAFDQAIREACEEKLPDVVLCHHLYLACGVAVRCVHEVAEARGFARPSVRGICHSTDLRQMGKHSLEREFIVEGVRALDCIFALHEPQKREIVELYGVPEERVRVVGSGYNDELFNPTDRAPSAAGEFACAGEPSHVVGELARIEGATADADGEPTHIGEATTYPEREPVRVVYVGKIWRKKGVESLIRCAQLLETMPSDITFNLVGGHNNEREFAELRAQADASPYRFDFPGKVDQNQLARIYRDSDVFVLPSFFEGLPLVVIEALACGCKAVVTDLPGIRPWISANIPAAPVWFVEPPRMEGVDEPVADDLPAFEQRLAKAIDAAAAAPAPSAANFAGIERVTWAGLAEKLIA